MDQDEAKRRSERVTGISNIAYDLMVVLTNKLEGVAAMEEYKLDAEAANDSAVGRSLRADRAARSAEHRGAARAADRPPAAHPASMRHSQQTQRRTTHDAAIS